MSWYKIQCFNKDENRWLNFSTEGDNYTGWGDSRIYSDDKNKTEKTLLIQSHSQKNLNWRIVVVDLDQDPRYQSTNSKFKEKVTGYGRLHWDDKKRPSIVYTEGE